MAKSHQQLFENPEVLTQDVSIDLKQNEIIVWWLFAGICPFYEIRYQQKADDCVVVCEQDGVRRMYPNKHFVDVFNDDLGRQLIKQKTVLRTFDISKMGRLDGLDTIGSRIFAGLVDTLQLKSQLFQLEELWVSQHFLETAITILPLIDAKVFRRIVLTGICDDWQRVQHILNVEQWREYDGFEMKMTVEEMSSDIICFIKRFLSTATFLHKLEILSSIFDEDSLNEMFGEPTVIDAETNETERETRANNSNRYVLRTLKTSHHIVFFRDVTNAVVRPFKSAFDGLESIFDDNNENAAVQVLGHALTMKIISNNLGLREIMSLRKVSSHIRKCVDHIKPDPKISKIRLNFVNFHKIELSICFETEQLTIEYERSGNGCFVDERRVDANFFVTCMRDLRIMVKNRTASSRLEELRLDLDIDKSMSHHVESGAADRSAEIVSYRKDFVRILGKAFDARLNVRKLNISIASKQQIEQFLKLTQPKSLESIEVTCSDILYLTVNLHDYAQLEQWKNAKELLLTKCVVLLPLAPIHLVHFQKVDIVVSRLSSEFVFELKEALLYSPTLVKFKISSFGCSINDDIYNLMGRPYSIPDDPLKKARHTWYYRMPNAQKALHVIYFVNKFVTISRVSINSVPDNAFVDDF